MHAILDDGFSQLAGNPPMAELARFDLVATPVPRPHVIPAVVREVAPPHHRHPPVKHLVPAPKKAVKVIAARHPAPVAHAVAKVRHVAAAPHAKPSKAAPSPKHPPAHAVPVAHVAKKPVKAKAGNGH
jgi:hypothetical protein